jgi:hypothetical protein
MDEIDAFLNETMGRNAAEGLSSEFRPPNTTPPKKSGNSVPLERLFDDATHYRSPSLEDLGENALDDNFDSWFDGYVDSIRPEVISNKPQPTSKPPIKSTSRPAPRFLPSTSTTLSRDSVQGGITSEPTPTLYQEPEIMPSESPAPPKSLYTSVPLTSAIPTPTPAAAAPKSMYKSIPLTSVIPTPQPAANAPKNGLIFNNHFNAPVSTADASSLVPMNKVAQSSGFSWGFPTNQQPTSAATPSVFATVQQQQQQPTRRAPINGSTNSY